MPIQRFLKILVVKNENFQKKKFSYINVGFKGVFNTRTCFPDIGNAKSMKLRISNHLAFQHTALECHPHSRFVCCFVTDIGNTSENNLKKTWQYI